MAKYQALSRAGNRGSLVQMKGGDRVHHPLAQARIEIAFVALQVGLGKIDRITDHNRDPAETELAAAPRERAMRSEDAHRNDRRERFGDQETDSWLRWKEIAIQGPRPFGENERAMFFANNADQCLKRTAIASFLVN